MAASEPKKTKPVEQTHRGLVMTDLPGRLRRAEQMLRWAMFKAGSWPPKSWRVPVALQGVELRLFLEERHVMFYANVGKGQGGRKEAQKEAKA